VREGYVALAKAEADRWTILDAAQSVTEIQEEIRLRVSDRLAGHENAGRVPT
jgi:thymidylate kinase